MSPPIPAAVAAVIAAIVTEHPLTPPEIVGQLAVRALVEDGWQIVPDPLCAPQISESAPCRPKARTRSRTPATR